MPQAVARRAYEELACTAAMHFTHKFEYYARFGAEGSERELCYVYVGVTDDPVVVNANEVADVAWVMPDALDRAMADPASAYTPWLKLEWAELRAQHWPSIEQRIRAQNG